MRSTKTRFAVVVSHPIQYYVPFYRALARVPGLSVHAVFASRVGLERMLDPDMGVEMAWQTDLLAGYSHEFLPEAASIKHTGFFSVNNPTVGRALDRFAPHAVLLHGYHQLTSLRALAWCRRRGVPALMISDSSLHIGTPGWARLVKPAVVPRILSPFRAFLSIGDANERYLATFGAKPHQIFRTPIMLDEGFWTFRAKREEERRRWRERLGLGEDELAILFVGKLVARKRPQDLLDAVETLGARQRVPRLRLIVAGNGALFEDLKSAASERGLPVSFLGFVNIDDLPGIYCAADVLAHPAEIETYGVVVLEAAVLGLPLVLSHRVGAIGPTSIAREGENALVHRSGDVRGLAEALGRLQREPDTRRRLAAASLAISAEHDGRASVAGALRALAYCRSPRLGAALAPERAQ